MSEGPPIVLQWDCRFEDHVVVSRRSMRRAMGIRASLLVAAVVVMCGAVAVVGGPQLRSTAIIVGIAYTLAVGLSLWRAPNRSTRKQERAGLLALGPMSLTLDAGGIWWRQDGSQSRLGWEAVRGLAVDRQGLWLTLSTGAQLRAPPRALATWDASRVAAWRASPGPAATLAFPPGAVHVVRGVLTHDVWDSALGMATKALRGRVWPRIVLAVVLYALLLVLSELLGADRRFARPIFVLASLGVTGVLLLLPRYVEWRRRRTLRRTPSRVPLGEVEAHLGPVGVWIRTPAGVSSFSWSWITSIHRDDRAVALVVGLGAVVALPTDAMAERDRLVADCRGWMEGAPRLRGGAPRPGRGTARGVDNAFAPPD